MPSLSTDTCPISPLSSIVTRRQTLVSRWSRVNPVIPCVCRVSRDTRVSYMSQSLIFRLSTRRRTTLHAHRSLKPYRERNEESTTKVQAETRTLTHRFRLLLSSARVFFAARFAWFRHLAWTYPCLRSIRCFRSQHSHREANRVVPAYLLVRSLTHAVSTITVQCIGPVGKPSSIMRLRRPPRHWVAWAWAASLVANVADSRHPSSVWSWPPLLQGEPEAHRGWRPSIAEYAWHP